MEDRVVAEAKFVPFTIAGLILLGWCGLNVVPLVVGVVSGDPIEGLVVSMPGLLGVFVMLAFVAPARRRMRAVVFADRVELSSSWVTRKFARIEASKIESVDVQDALLGRSRYGTVIVRGSGSRALKFSPIRDQHAFAEAIRSISSAASQKQRGNEEPSSVSGGSLAEQLSQLQTLRNTGALTDEQFEQAKSKLLG